MKHLIALLLLYFAFVCSARAQTIGTIRYDLAGYAYYYDGSHWIYGTTPYTCTGYVAGSSYYYCGRCYSSPGYYTFSLYSAIPKISYSPKWKEQIVAAETQIADIAAFQDAHDKLVAKIPAVRGAIPYAYGGLYGVTNSLLFGTYGYNTSTAYGFSAPPVTQLTSADPFGKIDPNQHLLSYFQIVDGINQGSATATADAGKTINNLINADTAFAEKQARRQAILQAIRELQDPPSTTTTSGTGKFGVLPPAGLKLNTGSPQPAPPAGASSGSPKLPLDERWNASAQKCIQCHYGTNGERKDGGFSIASFPKLDPDPRANLEKQLAVLARLELPIGHPKHMPPKEDLPEAEKADWSAIVLQTYRQAAAKAAAPMPKIK